MTAEPQRRALTRLCSSLGDSLASVIARPASDARRLVQNQSGDAVAALVIYECLLTFKYEVSIVWQQKWTATSVLFLANRWLLLGPNVFDLLFFFLPATKANYMAVAFMNSVFLLLSILQIALLTALRTSALWNFNYLLFFVIFILGSAPFATNLYGETVSHWISVQGPLPGPQKYYQVFDVSERLNMIMLYISRLSPIIADFLVLVFTWMKTYRQLRDARQLGMKLSLSACLARDGSIYFIAIFILNLARLLTANVPALIGNSPVNAFIVNLPQILLQRFLINLRQLNKARAEDDTSTEPSVRSVVFGVAVNSGRMGNIGESLAHGREDDEWSEYAGEDIEGVEQMQSQSLDLQSQVPDTPHMDSIP